MGKTFLGLLCAGVFGAAVSVLSVIVIDDMRVVDLGLVFSGIVGVCGLVGWLVTRSKAQLEDPEVAERVSRAVEQASAMSSEMSLAGAKAATASGSALMSRLRYLFSFSGRIGRKAYLIAQVVAGMLLLVLFSLTLEDPTDAASQVAYLLTLPILAHLLAFGARRTRDTGVNQWWFLLVFVPPVNFALMVFLLLVPTDEFRDARI
ncbi:DUF805 domain-containing protein [Thiosulfatihalobacter marinus]|uniref:DUF805 domain-containing protein n=1 Tax=Thiosulfatihalobacter marinus TaxID=2792481 RepID=UPI0018D931E0|nr:DUF805 domain-containing protein [Thiosulfatihalobacter marinus]